LSGREAGEYGVSAEESTVYDALVVGAGPAGCAAAYDLASTGRKVLLVDRFEFPRTKACAGALTVKTLRALRFSVAPVIREVCRSLVVGLRTDKFRTLQGADPICAMTVRSELDSFVLEKTIERGAEFRQITRILSIHINRNRVEIETESERILASYLVGADGANSTVAQLTGDCPSVFAGFAVECHIRTEKRYEMEFDFGVVPFGYGWVFPKGDHLNVGIYTNLPRRGVVTIEHLREYANVRLGDGKLEAIIGHPIGLGGPGYRPHSKRVFIVGDAAGLVDPLLGEGIYNAVVSGQAAAAAITCGGNDPALALQVFRQRMRTIRHDLEFCRDSAEMFYGDVDAGYRLLTSFIPRYALMKGFAAGRTFGATRRYFYAIPFARPPKLDLPSGM